MGYDGDMIMVDAHGLEDTSELKTCLDNIMGEGFFDEYNECHQYISKQSIVESNNIQLRYEKLIQDAETEEERDTLFEERDEALTEISEKEKEYEIKLAALEEAWREKTGVGEIDDVWSLE